MPISAEKRRDRPHPAAILCRRRMCLRRSRYWYYGRQGSASEIREDRFIAAAVRASSFVPGSPDGRNSIPGGVANSAPIIPKQSRLETTPKRRQSGKNVEYLKLAACANGTASVGFLQSQPQETRQINQLVRRLPRWRPNRRGIRSGSVRPKFTNFGTTNSNVIDRPFRA
jgi:hypothetical protein